jgi:hypothetical protein
MVGVDSNCLSFLIDALEGIEKPTDALADQKIALARIFFYGVPLFTTRTVKNECEDIPDPVRRAKHHSWIMTHFGTLPIRVPPEEIARRAERLHVSHRKPKDCTVLAEAEVTHLAVLLTYDDKFVRRLDGKSNVLLMKPLPYWESLNIEKGTKPRWEPDYVNPLVHQSWWLW